MSRGPRVGDVGTEIILSVIEKGKPVNLLGTTAVLQISRPDGLSVYDAITDGSDIKYTGQPDDNLWPCLGLYRIRGIVRWVDGRSFTTEDISVEVT